VLEMSVVVKQADELVVGRAVIQSANAIKQIVTQSLRN
jgi:hypothetical protein